MNVLQRYFNVVFIYSTIIIIFAYFPWDYLKPYLNRYVSAVTYHSTLTGSISVIGLFIFAFKIVVDNNYTCTPLLLY